MTDLITRLESADGPSRELDAEIAVVCGIDIGRSKGDPNDHRLPAYTASIDAALTLVPEGRHTEIEIWTDGRGRAEFNGVGTTCGAWGRTPALALAAAALKARGV